MENEANKAWDGLIEAAFLANTELLFAMKTAGVNRAERRRMMKFVTSGSSIARRIEKEVAANEESDES